MIRSNHLISKFTAGALPFPSSPDSQSIVGIEISLEIVSVLVPIRIDLAREINLPFLNPSPPLRRLFSRYCDAFIVLI